MAREQIEILFVEDSPEDVELSLLALRRDGLEASWTRVHTEDAMKETLEGAAPEVILSDFSMPGFDGLRALRLARELAPRVPFIFVSGTIGEERAIEAIRLGATDYVLKDNLRRLGTAVRRALGEATERERTRAAEEERARLVEILEATSDYVGMSEPGGRQIYLNAAGHRLTGIADDEVPGKAILEIYPSWAREIIEREAWPTAARVGLWQGETAMLDSQGRQIPVSQVIIAHRAAAGGVRFFSTIARDIRERKAYEARIQYLANYDALTGLPNRNLLADRAAQAIMHSRRTGRSCALLVLDIDGFRRVNDGLGQSAGDALLGFVAKYLRAAVRSGDTVARLAGDEFAVLATDLARPEDVLAVSRKIRESAAGAPFPIEEREVHVTFSVGASTYPRDGEEFDLLLQNANAAMHRMKQEGGNGVQFYAGAMTRQAAERVEIESALRTAFGRRELELHYQPQIDLASGRILGVEALMRWRHAGRGWISPAQFVPIAEECGLIEALGEWALLEGCRQLAAWRRTGHAQLRLAVNVSARQFRGGGFVESVERALRAEQVDARCLELELTESLLIENREQAVSTLERLKSLGVRIAVDDFGTGYSSLSYLSGLPVDCLKIDGSFVAQVTKGGRDATIAQAIVSLGRALGLRVVAEGVETTGQLQFLRAHGCDEAQGYLFARPCPTDAVSALLSGGSLLPAG